jgi:nitrate/TMAO reductase-like tetraheme cytochrome c subunit
MNSPIAPRGGVAAWLWRRPQRWYLLGIPAGGVLAFIVGMAVTGGSLGALNYTSGDAFCTSCHEMHTPLAELKQSTHYTNPFGVRAGCADCHIPPTFVAGLVKHIASGTKDSFWHVMSELDTPAKYEAHRLEMAQSVWKEFKANDSAECRSCHTPAAMAFAKQPAAAASAHQSLPTSGMTCIDCHRGIAHTLPQGG